VTEPPGNSRSSLTFQIALANVALYGLGLALFATVQSYRFRQDVNDGAVAFLWWAFLGGPALLVVTIGAAIRELSQAHANRHRCFAGLALAALPLAASAYVLFALTH
jgi:hypothetical protein